MDRLIERFPLKRGAHQGRRDGMCAMEMVAWLAGEEHSDEPQCACPVIAAFVRALNDALPSDAARTRWLRPLVPQLVNTRGSAADERRRGLQVADAVVREILPKALQRAGRTAEADLFRLLPPVADRANAALALCALRAYAQDQHAAEWLLERAADGATPARFVAAGVQAAREAAGTDGLRACVDIVLRICGPQGAQDVAADARELGA